jgi:pyridoxine 4-dehydrogenase
VKVAEIEAARKVVPIVTVQNMLQPDRPIGNPKNVLAYCENQKIGFIPWFPIASGKLAQPGGPVAQVATAAGATPPRYPSPGCCKRSP